MKIFRRAGMLVRGLEKTMGSFTLNIERLAIKTPGIYSLMGPNGCGKTTTAKLIAGLLAPDSGAVDTENLSPRDITFLARKPYMMNDSVYNNLVYPLKLRGIQPDPALCDGCLEKMGFLHRKKQKARSLSGGEQQKLAFLRALVFKPRLVIADEALTALDIDSLDLFENLILEQQKTDPIIWIFISHQIPHIRRLCDYIFFLYQGRLEAEGQAEDILFRSANSRVRQYLRAYGEGGVAHNDNSAHNGGERER
jgi:ABC-type multidrug transport system ATPase subunit